MSLEHRKATRYQDLAKARAEIARLFPLAMEVIENVLKNKQSPRNLRFEAAKLIYYHHAGKPPTLIDVDLEGSMSMSQADKLARATAEAQKAFREALDKADGLPVLDDFGAPALVGARAGTMDETSVSPDPEVSDVTPEDDSAPASEPEGDQPE